MVERIIPIEMEGENEEAQELSQSVEQLSVDPEVRDSPSLPRIQVKTREKRNEAEEILKDFDNLVERSNSILEMFSLPNASTIEKIIIVIDRAQDETFTPFIVNNTKYTPLSMIKRAITIFLKLKLLIRKDHQIAIVVLNESNASLQLNFTNDLKKLKEAVNKVTSCDAEDIFDLNSLFSVLDDIVVLPDNLQMITPPPYVVRCILFYGRSYTMPKIDITEEVKHFLEHPYFTCDVLMTHEPVESSNNCDKIFNVLQDLDKKGLAYFFPVCRNVLRLHNCTSKLLAHPLQRPIQKILKK